MSTTIDPLRSRVLDLDLLRVFIAVVECNGYTAAGQLLHRSQAAVSLQIKRLEEAAQVALLQHPRSTVQLTPQGEILLEYARRMMALNAEALGSLKSSDMVGKVRIGAGNYEATTVLPPLLSAFCKEHPGVQVEVHTGVAADINKKLGSAYDMTLNIYPPGTTRGVLLRREPLVWVTSAHDSPHLRTPLPLALLPSGSLLRSWIIDALGTAGRPWYLAHESSNIAAVQAAVAAGLAMTAFQRSSTLGLSGVRTLGEADGFPPLPVGEVRLDVAERFLTAAARQLHAALLEKLAHP